MTDRLVVKTSVNNLLEDTHDEVCLVRANVRTVQVQTDVRYSQHHFAQLFRCSDAP